MNKKEYFIPKTEVINTNLSICICAGSGELNEENPTNGIDNLRNGGDNPGDFSRRTFSVWDD